MGQHFTADEIHMATSGNAHNYVPTEDGGYFLDDYKRDKRAMTKPHIRFKDAVLCGKFMPLHLGHGLLIETAMANSERVTILLVSNMDTDTIDVGRRLRWLLEAYPTVRVRVVNDIDTHDDEISGSLKWAEYTREILGRYPDAVFSSETYGAFWAAHMNASHVMVDLERKNVRISANLIRKKPERYLSFIHPVARAFYRDPVVHTPVGPKQWSEVNAALTFASQERLELPKAEQLYVCCVPNKGWLGFSGIRKEPMAMNEFQLSEAMSNAAQRLTHLDDYEAKWSEFLSTAEIRPITLLAGEIVPIGRYTKTAGYAILTRTARDETRWNY